MHRVWLNLPTLNLWSVILSFCHSVIMSQIFSRRFCKYHRFIAWLCPSPSDVVRLLLTEKVYWHECRYCIWCQVTTGNEVLAQALALQSVAFKRLTCSKRQIMECWAEVCPLPKFPTLPPPFSDFLFVWDLFPKKIESPRPFTPKKHNFFTPLPLPPLV